MYPYFQFSKSFRVFFIHIFVTHSIEEAVYVSDQIAILLPRPSRVSDIIRPSGLREKDMLTIRRDPEYLDIVDEIWASLRSYVE